MLMLMIVNSKKKKKKKKKQYIMIKQHCSYRLINIYLFIF